MKYVVFGTGRMGRAIAWHLALDPKTDVIKLVDIDNPNLLKLSGELSEAGFAKKLIVCQDGKGRWNDGVMEPNNLSNVLHGMDVCIATCGYKDYVKLTEACIAHKVSMVDLGGNRDVVERQKLLDEQARSAGVTIVPDCGLAPGMIGILGMLAFQQVQHRKCTNIDVTMRVGGLPRSSNENPLRYSLTWSSEGLVNEYNTQADELRNGVLVKIDPLQDLEDIVIKTPWSSHKGDHEFEAFTTGGGSSNLPFLLKDKARNVSYKTLRYRGHCNIMRGIKYLGLFKQSLFTTLLDERLASPDGDDVVIAKAGSRGTLGNDKPTFVLYEIFCARDSKRGFTAMAQTTGFSAAIVAQMIAEKKIKATGVVDGEVAVPGEEFLNRLKTTGINVQVTYK